MKKFFCNGKGGFCESVTCPDNCEFFNGRGGQYEEVEEAKVAAYTPPENFTLNVVLDEGAKMPTRAHDADAGFDLYSREDAIIYNGDSHRFDTGVHVQIPQGYAGVIKSKSGLNVNYGVQSDGLIDSGYTGSIMVKLYNHGKAAVRIEKEQKISHLVIVPIFTPELVQVDSLEETDRGSDGFGSTGKF